MMGSENRYVMTTMLPFWSRIVFTAKGKRKGLRESSIVGHISAFVLVEYSTRARGHDESSLDPKGVSPSASGPLQSSEQRLTLSKPISERCPQS